MSGDDTIFALSSGSPPAAIAVIRISGPRAAEALRALAGRVPPARRAVLASLRQADGELLDSALVLFLPGPANSTGEDCAELHLHGGRAVIKAVEAALAALPGLRQAQAGEFTRRAFANGRLDLAEAEGLADLLSAETELQRRNAQALANGAFSRLVDGWREEVLHLAAGIEAVLDFSDEEDAEAAPAGFHQRLAKLSAAIGAWLDAPAAEALREGFRVVIAGPPNSGKSSLFNALVGEDAAIATPIAGTTRDILLRPVALGGVPFLFADTAGLRSDANDMVETIGIARATDEIARADLVLWLGKEGQGPDEAWEIASKIDLVGTEPKSAGSHAVSAVSGEGMAGLRQALIARARHSLPGPGQLAISVFQRSCLADAHHELQRGRTVGDMLLLAENLRRARVAFDRLSGRTTTEDMLDALFGRFCIGK